MKKLILSSFICVLSVFCFGNVQVYYPDNSNSLEQKNRIGYTTRYSNGQYNSSAYKSTNFNSTHYQPVTQIQLKPTGPRKSAERPYSGGTFESFIDWLRINTDSNWPGYVNDDYWETLFSIDPNLEDEARNWFESQGMKFPGDQPDPFEDPITDIPVIFTIVFLSIYLFYKKKKL